MAHLLLNQNLSHPLIMRCLTFAVLHSNIPTVLNYFSLYYYILLQLTSKNLF